MQLGTSFSHRHLKSLGIDPKNAIKEIKNLGFPWIRLGLYWDESEPEKGQYDFSEVEYLVNFCEENNIGITFTLGMKAQRYPEYYFPYWIKQEIKTDLTKKITFKENYELRKYVLKFIEKSIKKFKRYKCIKYWHVENEPLDPSGEHWFRIDAKILEEEINLVKKLDPKRKIMTNLAGNAITLRSVHTPLIKNSDAIGFNFYLRYPVSFLKIFTRYIGPLDSKETIKKIFKNIKKQGKEVWITELQAEPWEPGEIVTQKNNPPSFLPEHFEKNLSYAKELNADVVLMWGFEYWLKKRIDGDLRYWESISQLLDRT